MGGKQNKEKVSELNFRGKENKEKVSELKKIGGGGKKIKKKSAS